MRISDWSSDVCSSDLCAPCGITAEQCALRALQYLNSLQIVELSRKFGDFGEIRDHARCTLPEREALTANREPNARPRPTYLSAEAGRNGREVRDIAHISFDAAWSIDHLGKTSWWER